MHPFAGEPAATEWTARPISAIWAELLAIAATRARGREPVVIAVDGRSAAGKSTAAARLAEAVSAVVVHTDDVAWHHSFFGWTDLMRSGVLEPVRRGESVAYRPPAWDARARQGAIDVPAGCAGVIVEGVGAGRGELADLLDALVWVQSDAAGARSRGIARDGGDVAFWDEWEAEEVPFLDRQRPWERADLVIAGSPILDHDPHRDVVVAPGPLR